MAQANLIVFAHREGTNVVITTANGKQKAIFPNTGYRPTKATKQITLNGWKWGLVWK